MSEETITLPPVASSSPLRTSNTTAEISKALAKAQSEMPDAAKDASNPFFNSTYSTLGMVMKACRKCLTENEIATIQTPGRDGNSVTITTRLAHSSGEWYEGTAYCVPKDTSPQSVLAACTYLRRSGLGSMAGVASEDDDGNQASGRNSATRALETPNAAPKGGLNEAASLFEEDAPKARKPPAEQTESCVRGRILDVKRHTFKKKDGEEGERWEIHSEASDRAYGTFSATVADAASSAKSMGVPFDLWWVFSPDGKYMNCVGISPVSE